MAPRISTLQQKTQEMHRPFQPLDSTEGRAGRPIAAPQAQYAGGWNIIQDVTGRLASLYSSTSRGSKKDELNPLAAEAYSAAAFDLQNLNLTPEEREEYDRQAALAGQTTSAYLRNMADKNVQEFLAKNNVSYNDMMVAREARFKADQTGLEKVESKQLEMDQKILTTMEENNLAVYDSNGHINRSATLSKAYGISDSLQNLNSELDEQLARIGLNKDVYIMAKGPQKQAIDNLLMKQRIQDYNIVVLNEFLPTMHKILDGSIDTEDGLNSLKALIEAGKRGNLAIFATDKDMRESINSYLDSYYNEAEAFLKNKSISLKEKEDYLKMLKTRLQIEGLEGANKASQVERGMVKYPNISAGLLAQEGGLGAYLNPNEFDLATLGGAPLTNYYNGVPKQAIQEQSNLLQNAHNILEGSQPTAGSIANQKYAQGYIQDYGSKALQANSGNYNKISPEEKAAVNGTLANTVNQMIDVLTKPQDRTVQRDANARTANVITLINDNNYYNALKHPDNQQLKEQYTSLGDAVLKRSLTSGIGPAAVLARTSVENKDRTIIFNEKTRQFEPHPLAKRTTTSDIAKPAAGAAVGAVGGAVIGVPFIGATLGGSLATSPTGGTTQWSFDSAIHSLNQSLTYAIRTEELYLNRELTDQEVKTIAKAFPVILSTRGVNPKLFDMDFGMTPVNIEAVNE